MESKTSRGYETVGGGGPTSSDTRKTPSVVCFFSDKLWVIPDYMVDFIKGSS